MADRSKRVCEGMEGYLRGPDEPEWEDPAAGRDLPPESEGWVDSINAGVALQLARSPASQSVSGRSPSHAEGTPTRRATLGVEPKRKTEPIRKPLETGTAEISTFSSSRSQEKYPSYSDPASSLPDMKIGPSDQAAWSGRGQPGYLLSPKKESIEPEDLSQ